LISIENFANDRDHARMELEERMSRVACIWVRVQWFRRRSSPLTRIRSTTYNDKLAQLNWRAHLQVRNGNKA